jgi:hypothetical protein
MTRKAYKDRAEHIADAGLRAMARAAGREPVSPDVRIDAALRVLAAWVDPASEP